MLKKNIYRSELLAHDRRSKKIELFLSLAKKKSRVIKYFKFTKNINRKCFFYVIFLSFYDKIVLNHQVKSNINRFFEILNNSHERKKFRGLIIIYSFLSLICFIDGAHEWIDRKFLFCDIIDKMISIRNNVRIWMVIDKRILFFFQG
jgi:hypothetical protein